MARQSSILDHPSRTAIDAALMDGEPTRRIAARFGLPETNIRRYRNTHFAPMMAQAIEVRAAREVIHADDLAEQVRRLKSRAVAILERAENTGAERTALSAIREARGCIETLGKLAGELSEHQTNVNILVSPAWTRVRAVLIEALAPYPEARAAVAEVLEQVEQDATPHVGHSAPALPAPGDDS